MATKRGRAKDADGPRTRGGWTPAGTAAARRASRPDKATPRGDRTREELVAAARRVFERDGFVNVRVADIVAEAGVAHGTFYTYFESKQAAFIEVANDVERGLNEAVARPDDGAAPGVIEALRISHQRFFEYYSRNGAILALIEQVATMDAEFEAMRRRRRQIHVERVATTIERWQERGIAASHLDSYACATALVSMRSNLAAWLFEGDEHLVEAVAIDTLTEIWVRAVGLTSAQE
jgi:AcrR family transcriptional regulator